MVAIAYQGWQSQSLVSVVCEKSDAEASEMEEWKLVHARLRRIAKKRAALDHEELQLIRRAIVLAIWRHLGMTSIREYLEDVMGYGPTVASERVRVAEALDAMPVLEHALGTGELKYSAVREITRIATSKTEGAWAAACRGKNQRQIEELLAEREPGDRPESPRKPDLRAKDEKFRAVKPATRAALVVARQQLEAERGERLDDDEFLAALAGRVNAGDAPRTRAATRAATQVAVTFCPACQITRQTAGNQTIALRPEELSRALCDVQWIDVTGQHRSVQDITPALREKILARDHHRCRVPGCRATKCIEIHHIVPRELGGPHVPENLITLCDGHHAALHRGEIAIEGPASTAVITMVAAARADQVRAAEDLPELREDEEAEDLRRTFHVEDRSDQSRVHDIEQSRTFHVEDRSDQRPADDDEQTPRSFHVEDRSDRIEEQDKARGDASRRVKGLDALTVRGDESRCAKRFDSMEVHADAVLALTTLGFKKQFATEAVDCALDELGPGSTLEQVIRGALRRCPRPSA